MNLQQLESFWWVVRLGGFANAAQRLNVTQSTVSARIQELEASLGVQLFDRSLRAARLTAKGRALLPYAERFVELAAETRQRVAAPDVLAGTLRLGVSELVGVTWLPDLMREAKRRHPRLVVEIDIDMAKSLIDKLSAGALDVALVPARAPGPGFRTASLGHVPLACVASPALDLPDGVLTPEILARYPLISYSRQTAHHDAVQGWFHGGGVAFRVSDGCNSLSGQLVLARAGLGVTFMDPASYAAEVTRGTLRVVPVHPTPPSLELFAIWPSREQQSGARAVAELAVAASRFERAGAIAPAAAQPAA